MADQSLGATGTSVFLDGISGDYWAVFLLLMPTLLTLFGTERSSCFSVPRRLSRYTNMCPAWMQPQSSNNKKMISDIYRSYLILRPLG